MQLGMRMSRNSWNKQLHVLALLSALVASPTFAADQQPELTGDLRIHDPSVVEAGGRYVAFAVRRALSRQ